MVAALQIETGEAKMIHRRCRLGVDWKAHIVVAYVATHFIGV